MMCIHRDPISNILKVHQKLALLSAWVHDQQNHILSHRIYKFQCGQCRVCSRWDKEEQSIQDNMGIDYFMGQPTFRFWIQTPFFIFIFALQNIMEEIICSIRQSTHNNWLLKIPLMIRQYISDYQIFVWFYQFRRQP